MKLSVRMPLLIGAIVLLTSASIIICAEVLVTREMERSTFSEIISNTEANAEHLKTKLDSLVSQLTEIATRVRVRSMDWEGTVRSSLVADVSRIDSLEIGLTYPDGTTRYVTDNSTTNLGDRDYIKSAFSGKGTVSDVLISRATGQPVVMLSAPIYRNDEKGAPIIGVLVARKDGGSFLASLVEQIRIGRKSGYGFLVNSAGTYSAHPNHDLVLHQYNPIKEAEKDPSLKSLADMVETVTKEKSGSTTYIQDGKEMFCAFTEIKGYPWKLILTMEKAEVTENIARIRFTLLTIGGISMVLGIFLAFLLGRSITKPFISMAATLKDIGSGDLTRNIKEKGNDEITELSRAINDTIKSMKNLVGAIQNKVNALSNTNYELTVNMTKTSTAVGEISSNFEDIKGLEIKQQEESDQVNKALEEIKTTIGAQNKLVEEQTGRINTSSSAIEEMTANINSVSHTLAANKEHVDTLIGASERGRTVLGTVVESIKEIARDSEGLLEINSVMNNIASQTNLLSMNAAIEAAHAGEAGRGFAVVADEIRKLAETSGRQSKTTADMLKKIKSSIDSITKSSDEVLARFGAIDTGVKTVSEQELNIRNAMEEQEVGGQQILDSVARLKELTTSVQNGSGDMLKSGEDLIRETDEFISVSKESLSSMNDIVSGALNEIKKAVALVEEISLENNKNFDDLKIEAKKFKTATGGDKQLVLAIDDDQTHLDMTKSFLMENYDVTTVLSCGEALKLLYQGLNPSYILLDLMMPETDGWDTFERLKGLTNLHNVPIAIFTSSDDPEDRARSKRIGAVDFIRKPCTKNELLERVHKTLSAARVT